MYTREESECHAISTSCNMNTFEYESHTYILLPTEMGTYVMSSNLGILARLVRVVFALRNLFKKRSDEFHIIQPYFP